MANILQYTATGSSSGSKWNIWVRTLFFVNSGSGELTTAEQNKIAFSGVVNVPPFFSGPFAVSITLKDGDQSGAADVIVQDVSASSAKYSATANKLTIDSAFPGGSQRLVFERGNNNKETYITSSGLHAFAIHLTPSS